MIFLKVARRSSRKIFLLAVAVLVIALLLPTPQGLSVAGHRMLAVLAFAVIVWMTKTLDYAVSGVVIAALMAFLLGTAPSPNNPAVLMGTSDRSSSRTRCSASVSTSRSTRTRQPPSSISMIPTLVRSAGGEDGCGAHVDAEASVEVIATGTSAGAASSTSRPSRASRRHVNNWLVDNPLRRAVTDTNRGPL